MNIFEQTLKFQGYNIGQAYKDFLQLTRKPATELYLWQEEKKWEIVNHHLKHNPFYKHILKSKPNNWEDIPILQKSDLQQPVDAMMAEGYDKKNVYLSNTSGSSGHPFYFAKDKYAHALSWALVKHRLGQFNIGLNALQVRFYGIPLDKKSYLTEKLKDKLSSRKRFQVFDLSDEVLAEFLNYFKRHKVKFIYGYTSSILYFAKYLLSRDINLKSICPSLKVCIVTSELCIPEDKKTIADAFGIRVAIEYGSSELSVMGFEFPNEEMISSDELIYFENIEQPDGTTRLLCTSLFNKAFPLIRYSIGDSVEFDFNAEGRRIITKINGRVNDFVKLPSGKTAAGFTFYYISRSILESTGCLKEFRVRQTKIDTFILDVVATEKLTSEEIEDIKNKVEMYLEPGLIIEINYVNEIAKKANGKIQHFYSELTD